MKVDEVEKIRNQVFPSSRRKPGSSIFAMVWMPAFADMTPLRFYKVLSRLESLAILFF